MARHDTKPDPYVQGFFGIELAIRGKNYQNDGTGTYFSRVTGGEMEIKLIEHQVVYNNGVPRTLRIPGPTTFAPIVLYQGMTDDSAMWSWWADVARGRNVRKNASIIVYGQKPSTGVVDPTTGKTIYGSQKKARWDLEHVWPLKISGFTLDLDSPKAIVAEITLVAESITRVPADADESGLVSDLLFGSSSQIEAHDYHNQ